METDIKVILTKNPKDKPEDEGNMPFGKYFSDHMFICEYDEENGWHNARIQPYGPLQIDPACPVLHYGQEIFEGLKAYRTKDDSIQLFRPMDNARRLNKSAERMCMPKIDPELQVKAMKMLVEIEKDWVPHKENTSLYLRPAMIAYGAQLGVHAADKYLYFIICAPVGPYYKNGLKPIKIHIEDKYVRAVKGGTGFAKTGGNYAASLKASYEAEQKGFDQVLWLDGRNNKLVEEVGAMNMMFVINGEIVTPPTGESILSGITRKSILQIAEDKGIVTEVRKISIQEIFDAYDEGTLTEAFGTGTAAVVSPVGLLEYHGMEMNLNNGEIGPIAQMMYETLVGIQTGEVEDTHGWIEKVC